MLEGWQNCWWGAREAILFAKWHRCLRWQKRVGGEWMENRPFLGVAGGGCPGLHTHLLLPPGAVNAAVIHCIARRTTGHTC